MKNLFTIAATVLLHLTFGTAERHEGYLRALNAEDEKAAVVKEDLDMFSMPLETTMSVATEEESAGILWHWHWGGGPSPSPHPTHALFARNGDEQDEILPQYQKDSTHCIEAADEEICKGACFEPVHPNDCPKSANEYLTTVDNKCTNDVKDGELCEADSDGKCNTSDHVDNCSIDYNGNTAPTSIYRRVACCEGTAGTGNRKLELRPHEVPAEIKAALEKAGIEVFDVSLEELIGIVGNIVGETMEIPTDATAPEVHTKIIAALGKAGIDVPEVA